ncbi:cystine transport system substrate-binding protein [Paenibacillus sophorae]|uniref:Cystine transport system substrate-binding protein n=1 Tax=Paenibacillus sophorae TaxID=1333845 RepID=A0A1H8J0F9_9BACL|nr:cystine transport system substrate-binding protein [Paenibacillus sophorae]
MLETIKANGKIRVGTEGTYAPFTFHDESGKLTGFDVEIAQEVANCLGVQIEFIETNRDSLIAGLDTGQFDIVVNEITIRNDLKDKYDFSDPYIVSKAELIVHQDNRDIKRLANLKGKKAGQSLQNDLTDIAKESGAIIVQTEGFSQSIDLLTSKQIDVVINNGLFYLYMKRQNPDAPIKVVGRTVSSWKSGILVRKGNEELVNAINQALTDMRYDGTYLKISKKYFGLNVSR